VYTADEAGIASSTLIKSAMDYYVAGRYAVFAALNPTAANLLHHAVERALKGALVKKGMNLDALRDLKHNLQKIWVVFKTKYRTNPRQFDAVISALHKFERIRYLDLKIMESEITRGKPPTSPGSGLPKYTLRLGDIDELMDQVFTIASINHKAFVDQLFRDEAREYLAKENEVKAWKR
jgi:hypothetical protein